MRASPKQCPKCGKRGRCVDSRSSDDYIRRRYRCPCGGSWTTAEFFVEEGNRKNPFKVQEFKNRQGSASVREAISRLERLIDRDPE